MAVDSVIRNVASQISGAIQKAAQSTGISFNYLLTTAKIESNLNPAAQASTSSAKGLYQFIEQTWLGTVKQDGPALGLGRYAGAISQNADGRYQVADPDMRAAIMKLRSDPATSAMMAGAFSRNNANQLSAAIGRPPSEGELYVAHFLGPDGAGKLINAAMNNTRANAAAMFPAAAAANHNIFYNRDGSARSAGEVYGKLTAHFDKARTVMVAANAPVPPAPIPAGGVPPVTASQPAANNFLAAIPAASAAVSAPSKMAQVRAPDTAGITQAYAAASQTLAARPDTRPLFRAMFTDTERTPVTTTVAGLWAPADADGTAIAAPGLPVRALDLFTDSATNARGIFNGKA